MWNLEPVGQGFRCVANQPMRLLRNCVRAQHTSMKNEICNVEMWTQYNNKKNVGMPTGLLPQAYT